jgi:hypothetical protein
LVEENELEMRFGQEYLWFKKNNWLPNSGGSLVARADEPHRWDAINKNMDSDSA